MEKYKKIKNFKKLTSYFGSISDIAEALGISVFAIYKWEKIPKNRAYQIQVITRGKIKATQLISK